MSLQAFFDLFRTEKPRPPIRSDVVHMDAHPGDLEQMRLANTEYMRERATLLAERDFYRSELMRLGYTQPSLSARVELFRQDRLRQVRAS